MTVQKFSTTDIDFDAVYRGETPLVSEVQFDRPPWDIDAPQPVVVAAEAAGEFTGRVLDIGSGMGNNAIFLAEQGYSVLGVDGARTAVALAGERASARGTTVEFQVADATSLDGVEQQFDTVLDSALYHCLPEESRGDYAAALWRVTKPNAHLHLFCFADEASLPLPIPGVSTENLRSNLGKQWDITDIKPEKYVGAIGAEVAQRAFGQFSEEAVPLPESDDQGRILFPVWHLQASRKS